MKKRRFFSAQITFAFRKMRQRLWFLIRKPSSVERALLEGRGAVLRRPVGDAFEDLAGDFFPLASEEMQRDIFMLLIIWHTQSVRGNSKLFLGNGGKIEASNLDVFATLEKISDLAWLGFTDTEALKRLTLNSVPSGEFRNSFIRYLNELTQKGGQCFFLLTVSRIAIHHNPQHHFPNLDTIGKHFATRQAADIVRDLFSDLPDKKRQENVFLLALLLQPRGKHQVPWNIHEFLVAMSAQLRLMLTEPQAVVAKLNASDPYALKLIMAAKELETTAGRPWLLETLFLAESWMVGKKHFDHAPDITCISGLVLSGR